MRLAAPMLVALVLVAPAAAAGRTPVKVVSTVSVLERADVAPVAVRCRSHRPCRAVVRLAVPQRHLPVGCPTCLVTVGTAQVRIPAGRTRIVAVPRRGPADFSALADSWPVEAVARVRGERLGQEELARRLRSVRLDAPAALQRPAVPLALVDVLSRWGLDEPRDDNALRFEVRVPRGIDSARVELRDRTVDLHPAMTDGPYVVPRRSFAPAGTLLHGEMPIGRDEFRYGERYAMRVTACEGSSCQSLAADREVSRGAYGYGDPICRLRLARGFTRSGQPVVTHPGALAALVAAPAAFVD